MTLISIVVTSYSFDRFDDIKDLLQSIKRQTKKNFEVIYVTERDMRLHDSIKREIQDSGINAKVIHNYGRPGLAEARNLGASVASGDIIAFVDDDVILDKEWSQAVENAFRMFSDIAAITGPAYPLWVEEKADWLPVELDWLIGCTRWFRSDKPVEVRNCWGMNMAFKKFAFMLVGGFSSGATERSRYLRSGLSEEWAPKDQGLMAEDVDISLRLKAVSSERIIYIPRMIVYSKVYPYRLGVRFIMERSRWIGYTRRNIGKVLGPKPETYDQESNLLRGLLLSFFDFRSIDQISINSIFKRYRINILTLFALLVGYLMGPV